MKTHILTLAAIAALTTLGLGDSPDAILKDYRKQATQATQRLNETLEKQSAPIITSLIRKGDTAGAEAVTAQVKAKLAGEPIAAPHVAIAALLAQYDGARATALQPVQKTSLARLDSLLNVSGVPKVADLEAITQAKTEIEAAKTGNASKISVAWTYHKTPTSVAMAKVFFETDGKLRVEDGAENPTGTWQMEKNGTLSAKLPKDTWMVAIKKDFAELDSKIVGRRFLIPIKN